MQIPESQVTAAIREYGPAKTLESFLTVNNAKTLTSSAESWEIVHERSTIIDALMKEWITKMTLETLKEDPVAKGVFPFNFAFLAVGGYGRGEMNPNSDVDIRLIVDDTKLQENPLVLRYKDDIYNGIAKREYGLSPDFIVHNLNDLPGLTGAEITQIMDRRTLYGNLDLDDIIKRILKEQCDPSELCLNYVRLLEELKRKYPQSFHDAEGFNVKFGIGGLRHFHTSIWIEAAETFSSCRETYARAEIPESVYEAAGIMLKTRSWLNLQRDKNPVIKKPHAITADTFTLKDMEALSPASRERLLFARREISRFAESKLNEKMRKGIRITPDITFDSEGLRADGHTLEIPPAKRNDLFFSLYHTAHTRGLPINPIMHTTLCKNADQWVRPHPLFVQLFYDDGSLSRTLKRLADAHCLGKLIPGFSALEASLYEPGHHARHLTRAGFALQKIEALEEIVGEHSPVQHLTHEYKVLSSDYRAAIRLALLVKHIPKSERIPGVLQQSPTEYMDTLVECYPSFPREALDVAAFLIENHTLFNTTIEGRLNDEYTVRRFKKEVGDTERLRALYLFTHADQGSLDKSNTSYWDNAEELYIKTMNRFLGKAKKSPYDPAALDETGMVIADDLGPDFMSGRYAKSAMSWISYLKMAHETGHPIIRPLNQENRIGIACEDYPGLLAVITGMLYDSGANVNQAHAYSLSKHHLALDMFDFTPGVLQQKELIARLTDDIKNRRLIQQDPFAILAPLKKKVDVEYRGRSQYSVLSFVSETDRPGIMYALTRILHEQLGANIYGLNAYSPKGKPIHDYIFFKAGKKFSEISARVKELFK